MLKESILELKELAKDKTVLLVEDDEFIIKNISDMLEKFFCTIYKASNADDALEIYEKLMQDAIATLVITDINLGQKNGIELIRNIKQKDQNQKIIVISGTENREIFIESIKYAVERFVLKPIVLSEFFDSLTATLKKMEYDLELKKSQEELKKSKEYALKLLEEQDRFLKNAIHEIHTPLAIIITNIDLLKLEGARGISLDSIEAGSKMIQNSYEDMTYLMKKDRSVNQKENLSLVDFIAQRVEYFTCIANANQLSFNFFAESPDLPELYFCELKLARLVDNTLSNAIKYSKRPNQISVKVGMELGSLFFEVKNYGPLIEDKEKIFDRFYRETDEKGGYGLGLNIVKQICEEERVEIGIVSTTLDGTIFRYKFENGTISQH